MHAKCWHLWHECLSICQSTTCCNTPSLMPALSVSAVQIWLLHRRQNVSSSLLVAIVCLQLLLKGQDLLIPLIEPACQGNHDVTLLQQELLIPVHLQQTGWLSPLGASLLSSTCQQGPERSLCRVHSGAALDCSPHLHTTLCHALPLLHTLNLMDARGMHHLGDLVL